LIHKTIVTSALIYANGDLHLGHIAEQIQADIWVRFHKLLGHDYIYICGDDAHGTPIMISAQKAGKSPEEIIFEAKISHEKDSCGFLINFDNYHSTHSKENLDLTTFIYDKLIKNNDIETKIIWQAYDEEIGIFLPDRYIIGTCPKCKSKDQYGDNCINCGSIYAPSDLINPISIISKKPPIQKSSVHYFFRMEKYEHFVKQWGEKNLPREVINKLNEWFKYGIKAWDISRDSPYFGFLIPNTTNKYFYVWFDAPIGYLASLQHFCINNNLNFEQYLHPDNKNVNFVHFIGKDIMYFHALFWPAMLHSANIHQPDSIFIHGYLTINGEKMSKSRGTFILARDYLKYLDPEYLRYYLASKFGPNICDIDLNFSDFIQKNNSDLVGKIVNIASRSSKFIVDNFDCKLSAQLLNPILFQEGQSFAKKIEESYKNRNYNLVIRNIMHLADITNQYLDDQKPWNLSKINSHDPLIQSICTMGINMYRLLIIFLKPILPKLALKSENFLKIDPLMWECIQYPLLNHQINKFIPMIQRVDPDNVKSISTK